MWLTAPNRLGFAAWVDGAMAWRLDARGGEHSIQLGGDSHSVQLTSSDENALPLLQEQFVRGDELHLAFPQVEGVNDFGFNLVFRPIASSESESTARVLECLVSIQTTLLDLEPTIDIVVPEADGSRLADVEAEGVATSFSGNLFSGAVLLGRHDAPFTSVDVSNKQTTFRLFGEFLEKGVIRRARPWLVLESRANQTCSEPFLQSLLKELQASPLPLT
ncbi:MAG: hypothetical protein AAFV88_15015 [Planctomycetota bacterium]